MVDTEKARRWRLLLGPETEEEFSKMQSDFQLNDYDSGIDQALQAIYDGTDTMNFGKNGSGSGGKTGGKGASSPVLAKWLADIRSYFKEDIVSIIQADAISIKGLQQLILEPETLKNITPDINMVSTLMSLNGKIPQKTKETARILVRSLVEEINKKLQNDMRRAITGAINKKEHSPIPSSVSIDWKYTIRRNIKNYNSDLKKIIPERFFFFDRATQKNKWTVIVDMDQSGSMGESIIYGSVAGCILSGMSSLKTYVVAFDTEVVDLTEKYGSDPVDMIFGVQLGGGTDINKSIAYCEKFITDPKNTIFIILSDMYEGGNLSQMYTRIENMVAQGVKVIGLLALSDQGTPSYDPNVAKKLVSKGVPCFACTPTKLPTLLEMAIKGRNLMEFEKLK